MAVIEQVQNALDDMGGIRKIVLHLSSGVSDVIIQEALALMVKMLFAGNSQVQVVCRQVQAVCSQMQVVCSQFM